ncbi:hypothetical protein [Nonlabens sp.]|uniref:hypothetical protein n=1 Tax=Nonlabens sp. TaxID=1888209 RepID=UPI001BCD270C|nr:hypothetical protein [Nonlabens sp.]
MVSFLPKGEPIVKDLALPLDPGRNYGKTNPLNDTDMEEFIAFAKTKPESEQSWNINVADIVSAKPDLDIG